MCMPSYSVYTMKSVLTTLTVTSALAVHIQSSTQVDLSANMEAEPAMVPAFAEMETTDMEVEFDADFDLENVEYVTVDKSHEVLFLEDSAFDGKDVIFVEFSDDMMASPAFVEEEDYEEMEEEMEESAPTTIPYRPGVVPGSASASTNTVIPYRPGVVPNKAPTSTTTAAATKPAAQKPAAKPTANGNSKPAAAPQKPASKPAAAQKKPSKVVRKSRKPSNGQRKKPVSVTPVGGVRTTTSYTTYTDDGARQEVSKTTNSAGGGLTITKTYRNADGSVAPAPAPAPIDPHQGVSVEDGAPAEDAPAVGGYVDDAVDGTKRGAVYVKDKTVDGYRYVADSKAGKATRRAARDAGRAIAGGTEDAIDYSKDTAKKVKKSNFGQTVSDGAKKTGKAIKKGWKWVVRKTKDGYQWVKEKVTDLVDDDSESESWFQSNNKKGGSGARVVRADHSSDRSYTVRGNAQEGFYGSDGKEFGSTYPSERELSKLRDEWMRKKGTSYSTSSPSFIETVSSYMAEVVGRI